jgi:hypothetical protein
MEDRKKQPIPISQEAKPQQASGRIPLAGESVPIAPTSVPSSEGGTADEVVKGLEKLSKKKIFSEPPDEESN